MSEALKLLEAVRALHVDPIAAVIVAAVVVAWLEQRMTHARTPPFTAAHQGLATHIKARRY